MERDQLVSIQVPDIEKIKARLGSLESKAPGILSKSINATIRKLSPLMVKEAQKGYWVKATAAKKTLSIKKARTTALFGAVVSKSSERIKLFGFKASPKTPAPTGNATVTLPPSPRQKPSSTTWSLTPMPSLSL